MLVQAVQSPSILLGAGFLIIFFVLFAIALSRADLSFVVPAISAEVVLNVAFADYFLNETVSSTRWIGAVLISIGVILVLWSSPRTFGLPGDRIYAVDEVGR
jgi:drug/metabolite transporter (DMT)-like permease